MLIKINDEFTVNEEMVIMETGAEFVITSALNEDVRQALDNNPDIAPLAYTSQEESKGKIITECTVVLQNINGSSIPLQVIDKKDFAGGNTDLKIGMVLHKVVERDEAPDQAKEHGIVSIAMIEYTNPIIINKLEVVQ